MTPCVRSRRRIWPFALACVVSSLLVIGLLSPPIAYAEDSRSAGDAGSTEVTLPPETDSEKSAEQAARKSWEREAASFGYGGPPVVLDMGKRDQVNAFHEKFRRFVATQKAPLRSIASITRRAEQAKTPMERMLFYRFLIDHPITSSPDLRRVVTAMRWLTEESARSEVAAREIFDELLAPLGRNIGRLGKQGLPDVLPAVEGSSPVSIVSGPAVTIVPELDDVVAELVREEHSRFSVLERWIPGVATLRKGGTERTRARYYPLAVLADLAGQRKNTKTIAEFKSMKGSWDSDIERIGDAGIAAIGDAETVRALVGRAKTGGPEKRLWSHGRMAIDEILEAWKDPTLSASQRSNLCSSLPPICDQDTMDRYMQVLFKEDSSDEIQFLIGRAVAWPDGYWIPNEIRLKLMSHRHPEVRFGSILRLLRNKQNRTPIPLVFRRRLEELTLDRNEAVRDTAKELMNYGKFE